jgi:hypothetical protein
MYARNLSRPPRLPTITPDSQRRWARHATWTPPDSLLLIRHRSSDGERCVVTASGSPPRGYSLEFHLGLVSRHGQLGTRRLIGTPDGFKMTDVEGELDERYTDLGYVEQAPLPMLDVLELRLDPASGRPVLVAGADDPLFSTARPVAVLGFIESYPINPRRVPTRPSERGLLTLVRRSHPQLWRHEYESVEEPAPDELALGGMPVAPGPGLVALQRRATGEIVSELITPARGGVNPPAIARWALAPLGWSGRVPRTWALKASAGRTRALLNRQALISGRSSTRAEAEVLGYLRREAADGWSRLFYARHPAIGDQFLTRSELEARDLGYVVEGVLGYVMDRQAARHREELPGEIKWGSRFGHRRRYAEGAVS